MNLLRPTDSLSVTSHADLHAANNALTCPFSTLLCTLPSLCIIVNILDFMLDVRVTEVKGTRL